MKSMTGFVRLCGTIGRGRRVEITIRTLNSRSLDMRLSLPFFFAPLENDIREEIKKRVERGRVEFYLLADESVRDLYIDEKILQHLLRRLNRTFKKVLKKEVPPELLVSLKEYYIKKPSTLEFSAKRKFLKLTKRALLELEKMRRREGENMRRELWRLISKIEKLSKLIEKEENYQKRQIREDLKKMLESLKETEEGMKRIESEIANVITKRDISEERVRLISHVKEFKKTLKEKGAVGKKLDFLAQEILREATAMSSKAYRYSLSKISIEIKILVEKMREILNNIE